MEGVLRHQRGRVAAAAAAASWPTILPMSHLLLETGLFHSLLDLIYTFCKALSNKGSWQWCMLWRREGVELALKGANQIKVLQTGSEKLKPVPDLCFYYCARKLSDPARNRFSFNYMFHVCVPRLHAQRPLSRPNISHAYPHLNTQLIAYQNRTSQGLWRTCVYVCSICICTVYVFANSIWGTFPQSMSSGACHVFFTSSIVLCFA